MYISAEDFFEKAELCSCLSRSEEKECALKMAQGDASAKEKLIQSYLPFVASIIKRAPKSIQTLHTVYSAIASLERGVESFDFLQESESFSHHLSYRMRCVIVNCIANRS